MTKGDVHTVHHDGKWFNEVEGNQRASNSAETKAAAQAKGREMAQKAKVEHHIHKLDGTIGEATPTGTTRCAPGVAQAAPRATFRPMPNAAAGRVGRS